MVRRTTSAFAGALLLRRRRYSSAPGACIGARAMLGDGTYGTIWIYDPASGTTEEIDTGQR